DVGAKPVYSVRKGSAAERRSWKPQPVMVATASDASATDSVRRARLVLTPPRAGDLPASAPLRCADPVRAARIDASDHDVDQAAGAAFGVANEALGRHGGGFDRGTVGLRGHAHGSAHLAVDLQHEFDLVLRQGAFVDLRPRGVEQVTVALRVAEPAPQR